MQCRIEWTFMHLCKLTTEDNMEKNQFWKKRYQHSWKEGNKREQLVKSLLEEQGHKVYVNGFGAMSTEYKPENPEEAGIPDMYIEVNGEKIYFEVTGTDYHTEPKADIWVRPDKVKYAKKHGVTVYCVHVLSKINLVRLIKMNDIDSSKIIYPKIRGTVERYIAVPAEDFEDWNDVIF